MKTASVRKSRKRAGATPPLPPVEKIAVRRNMTIYEANALKDELLHAPAQGNLIELDLSQVQEIDTAGMQLLLLLQRENHKQGKTLRLSSCSPAVQELIQLYDLAALFGMAQTLAAPDAALD